TRKAIRCRGCVSTCGEMVGDIPEKIKQAYLEVREIATRQVLTAIEILSPVNKRSG
ncbi:MAG TPA: hypothetical protein DCE56_01605, partial [Cyanobacteria bacterium UBA8553]|nr:hypothetical protein [Cyanobacteria bacterium UBA8553]